MTTANSPASKEVVTAALLVIGSRILSGRTKDQNIGYIAQYLTALGIDLKEVRVVGDEERAIVDALNPPFHAPDHKLQGRGWWVAPALDQRSPEGASAPSTSRWSTAG
jgi:hypothetical protein